MAKSKSLYLILLVALVAPIIHGHSWKSLVTNEELVDPERRMISFSEDDHIDYSKYGFMPIADERGVHLTFKGARKYYLPVTCEIVHYRDSEYDIVEFDNRIIFTYSALMENMKPKIELKWIENDEELRDVRLKETIEEIATNGDVVKIFLRKLSIYTSILRESKGKSTFQSAVDSAYNDLVSAWIDLPKDEQVKRTLPKRAVIGKRR